MKGDELDESSDALSLEKEESKSVQGQLLFADRINNSEEHYTNPSVKKILEDKTPNATEINFDDLKEMEFDYAIAALGFEERTYESIKKILQLKFKKILLIKYSGDGKEKAILKLIKDAKVNFEIIPFEQIKTSFDSPIGNIFCDITGCSKSLIFTIVRNVLKTNNKICVSHTKAEKYYPLNEEIKTILEQINNNDNPSKLDVITQKYY